MKYNLKFNGRYTDDYAYKDQDGCIWTSPTDWLFMGILGGCGCGSSEELGKRAFRVLSYYALEWELREKKKYSIYDNKTDEVLAHWLTEKELLEHGTSIGGSWLTDKGREIFEVLESLKPL